MRMPEEQLEELLKRSSAKTLVVRDPKVRFQKAIETLEAYAKSAESNTFPPIGILLSEGKGLKKVIHLAKGLIASAFSERFREKNQQERQSAEIEVLTALEDVSRFHPVIRKKETEDAKALSQRALATLAAYKSLEDRNKKDETGWHRRLLKFLIKRSHSSTSKEHTLPLPLNAGRLSLKHDEGEAGAERFRSIFANRGVQVPLSERERDAFRMKAISLMKNEPLLFPSIKDTLEAIRNTPIYSTTTQSPGQDNATDASIITLEQMLNPFPGEILILRGSFKRDPKSLTPSTPITDSFEMTRESVQSGFPAPSQASGWSLADPLFPPPSLLPITSFLTSLLEKKEEIANAFKNRSPLLEKARETARKKSAAVTHRRHEFLGLHKTLAQSLSSAACRGHQKKETIAAIEKYFTVLEKTDDPFEDLSALYQKIGHLYIEAPHAALIELWAQEKCPGLYDLFPKKRMEAAREIALNELAQAKNKAELCFEDEPQKQFGELLGWMLGKASISIYLQYFSERLESPPPQLSDFERKLQTAALWQQLAFIKETELPGQSPDETFQTLSDSLKKEIELFRPAGKCDPFCRELENYYLCRFQGNN